MIYINLGIGDRVVATKKKIESKLVINRGERMTVIDVRTGRQPLNVRFDTNQNLDSIGHVIGTWWITPKYLDIVKKYDYEI